MSDEYTLYIIVSNDLRTKSFLGDKRDVPLLLINSALVSLQEPSLIPDPWGRELQRDISGEIEKWKTHQNLRVRIAGHVGPCFRKGTAQGRHLLDDFSRNDQRFPDREESLNKELSSSLDVQVWGFHHENYSLIWNTLESVTLITKSDVTDEKKRMFEQALEHAFQQVQIQASPGEEADEKRIRFDRLSGIRHHILSQFVPLRIKLETAAERNAAASQATEVPARDKSAKRAEELIRDVHQALPEKLKKACLLLDEFAALIPKGRDNPLWKLVAEKLNRPLTIQQEEFWQWLDELDHSLKNLVQQSHE